MIYVLIWKFLVISRIGGANYGRILLTVGAGAGGRKGTNEINEQEKEQG